MRILVVEDEPRVADIIRRSVRREGWSTDLVDNGQDALWAATEQDYDVIVLDVNIPAPDGFEVCRQLRERERWTPILFLTARAEVADRVTALDTGGDDYLAKPFALEELHARLRALTRRTLGQRPTTLTVGNLQLDPATRAVSRDRTPIDLTAKEFAILELLMRRPGEVITRTELLDHAWDGDYVGTSNVVDVYVRYLREKVDRPFGTSTIQTVRGSGYRTAPETADVAPSS